MSENIKTIESADRVEMFNSLKTQLAAFIAENGNWLALPERTRPKDINFGPETKAPAVHLETKDNVILVSERNQYPWGHKNTGAKLGLPPIALEKNGSAAVALNQDSFPLNTFVISSTPDGQITIATHGDHSQFDFKRLHKDEFIQGHTFKEGSAYISLTDGRYITIRKEQAEELEQELLDGAMNMLREMIKVDVDNLPPAFRQVIDNVRARVDSVQNGPREGLPLSLGALRIPGGF